MAAEQEEPEVAAERKRGRDGRRGRGRGREEEREREEEVGGNTRRRRRDSYSYMDRGGGGEGKGALRACVVETCRGCSDTHGAGTPPCSTGYSPLQSRCKLPILEGCARASASTARL